MFGNYHGPNQMDFQTLRSMFSPAGLLIFTFMQNCRNQINSLYGTIVKTGKKLGQYTKDVIIGSLSFAVCLIIRGSHQRKKGATTTL